MSNDIVNYVRKQFPVRAARVTPLNIDEIARWCNGVIKSGEKEGNFSRLFIKVRVAYPTSEKQTEAHVGDWVVKSGRTFKVYNDKAFRRTFEHEDKSPVGFENIETEAPAPKGPSPRDMPMKKPEAAKGPSPRDMPMKKPEAAEPVEAPLPEGVEMSDGAVSGTLESHPS